MTKAKAKRGAETPRLINHPPEIEARRAEYAKLAEALVVAMDAQRRHAVSVLDVVPAGWTDDEPEPHILLYALREHLEAVLTAVLDCYDDEFMRVLYVELRLYYDARMLTFRAGPWSHLKKREGEADE